MTIMAVAAPGLEAASPDHRGRCSSPDYDAAAPIFMPRRVASASSLPLYNRGSGGRSMKIAIVRGGIGGLTTALALTRRGLPVTVHERSPQLVDQGAGITLAPNATRVLYYLGLGADL